MFMLANPFDKNTHVKVTEQHSDGSQSTYIDRGINAPNAISIIVVICLSVIIIEFALKIFTFIFLPLMIVTLPIKILSDKKSKLYILTRLFVFFITIIFISGSIQFYSPLFMGLKDLLGNEFIFYTVKLITIVSYPFFQMIEMCIVPFYYGFTIFLIIVYLLLKFTLIYKKNNNIKIMSFVKDNIYMFFIIVFIVTVLYFTDKFNELKFVNLSNIRLTNIEWFYSISNKNKEFFKPEQARKTLFPNKYKEKNHKKKDKPYTKYQPININK